MLKYQLIRSHKKNLSLHVKNNALIARAPMWMPQYEIEQFISQKQHWITKKLAASSHVPIESILLGGVRYGFAYSNDTLSYDGTMFTGKICAETILAYYKHHFAPIIKELVPKISDKYHLSYNQVRIKKLKSRWGSCSMINNLNFNYLLAAAPSSVIRDVVIHELCHTKYKNHSPAFWQLVYDISPEYDTTKLWLKTHQTEVLSILDTAQYDARLALR